MELSWLSRRSLRSVMYVLHCASSPPRSSLSLARLFAREIAHLRWRASSLAPSVFLCLPVSPTHAALPRPSPVPLSPSSLSFCSPFPFQFYCPGHVLFRRRLASSIPCRSTAPASPVCAREALALPPMLCTCRSRCSYIIYLLLRCTAPRCTTLLPSRMSIWMWIR